MFVSLDIVRDSAFLVRTSPISITGIRVESCSGGSDLLVNHLTEVVATQTPAPVYTAHVPVQAGIWVYQAVSSLFEQGR